MGCAKAVLIKSFDRLRTNGECLTPLRLRSGKRHEIDLFSATLTRHPSCSPPDRIN